VGVPVGVEGEEDRRLGGLEGVLGSVLSSQRCGKGGGRLKSTRDGLSAGNLRERVVEFFGLGRGKPRDAVRAGAQGEKDASLGCPRSSET